MNISNLEYANKRRRGRARYANWGSNYTTDESIADKYKVDDMKWKLSRAYPQIIDDRALQFFVKMKRLRGNDFNCPLVNYTLSCVSVDTRVDSHTSSSNNNSNSGNVDRIRDKGSNIPAYQKGYDIIF